MRLKKSVKRTVAILLAVAIVGTGNGVSTMDIIDMQGCSLKKKRIVEL